MKIGSTELKEILVDSGLVPEDKFESAVIEAGKSKRSLEEVLVDQNLVPDEYLGQMIAEKIGFPFIQPENQSVPGHILRIVPEKVARNSRIVAFGKDESGRIKLAMADPTDLELVRMIEKKMGVRAIPHFATFSGIQKVLELYASDLESAIRNILEQGDVTDEDEGSAVEVVSLIVSYAYQSGASDIHIEPRESEIVVRYRIDGILHDVVSLPRELLDPIISRIKVLSKMRTDEHFAAQDGKFQEIVNGERIDVRVSALPVVDGEKIVMRLLAEKGRRYNLSDLGLSDEDMKKVKQHSLKSYGMILATGPTGSGKTTTMYAVLKTLNTRDVNIATIEDPIEYAMEGVNQIQVNPKVGLTFASGLRSIVRQDPDIVMVGEIRDEETAGISVNAAMTGHLVLSTLHTNDAATALPRFRDMKIEPFLISSSINLIIAQRLVRKICSRCIVSIKVKREDMKERLSDEVIRILENRQTANKEDDSFHLYHGKGCDRCNQTGYSGRIGIYEMLEITDGIRELIMADANAKLIRNKAVENGMTTMLDDGVRKVIAGLTTLDEIVRVAGL